MSDGIEREITNLNYWPSSQLCMECKHGKFIMDEEEPASTYACKAGVALGPCERSCDFQEKINDRFIANDPIEW